MRVVPAVRWSGVAWDLCVAAVVLLLSLTLASGAGRGQPGTRPVDVWAYGLMAVSCAVLVVRRRYPLPVAGVLGGALLVFAVREYPGGPLVVAVMVALYTVGVWVDRRRALAVAVVAVLLVAARSVSVVAAHGQVSAFSWAAPGWVVTCLLAGMVVRARRQMVQAIRDRAELAERTKEEEARLRVVDERLRIARDLHDVIGHSFAAVHVQARAAAALMDTDLVGARQAVAAIEAVSRDALREIRATLSTLRQGGTAAAGVAATAGLEGLLAPARVAGLSVHTAVDEVLAALPAVVEEVVYRVVQESLTNVLRHAEASTVTVTIAADGDAVRVEVLDDGTGGSPARGVHGNGPGQGLAGMRERVTAVGGRLDTGPMVGGGWRVAAWLPVQG